MGRKVIPIEEKKKMGNPGKRKLPENVPKIKTENIPSPPCYLDDYARQEWHRLSDAMWRIGTLTDGDVENLAAYCSAYSQERSALEEIQGLAKVSRLSSLLVPTFNGTMIQNPLISIANTARRDKVKYAAELGLTPSSRSRLGVDLSKNKKDPDDDRLLNGGKN